MNPAKLESGEEEEAEQRLKPEAVKETGTTQSGAGPAKRKREADENDGVEELEKWGYRRKDITDDEEDVETEFPKVTHSQHNCRLEEATTAEHRPSLRHSRHLHRPRGRSGRSRV